MEDHLHADLRRLEAIWRMKEELPRLSARSRKPGLCRPVRTRRQPRGGGQCGGVHGIGAAPITRALSKTDDQEKPSEHVVMQSATTD